MPALDPGVSALLEGAPIAHLATLMPDGAPHSVPVWVGVEDGRLAFLTSPGSRKARNLERDPRLCVSLTHEHAPTTMAQVRGHVAEQRDGEDAWRVIDRISEKYIGAPHPVREDLVLYLVECDRSWRQSFG
jgi:PPOX class probable F420-dependent enzyme